MQEFKTSMDVYREIRKNRDQLRMARGMRKRDLTKYHNKLVRLYEQKRKEETDEREKAKAKDGM